MGYLKTIRKLLLTALIAVSLSGCTAAAALSAIPAALIDVVADQFIGQEKSFPNSIDSTMAATQQSLWTMKLEIDVIETLEGNNYNLGFSNDKLDGKVTLTEQTQRLSTLYVRVKSKIREQSIEDAIIREVEQTLRKSPRKKRINLSKYNNLRAHPAISAKHVGWYRPGAKLEVMPATGKDKAWVKIKMPSGKEAFLKGGIVPSTHIVK